MSRYFVLTATCLAVACFAATVHAQCGSGGRHYGGYAPAYSNSGYARPYYSGYPQPPYYPQSNYYQPRQFVPTYTSGNYYGGYAAPNYAPTYSAPQGSSSRRYDSAPIYQSQPSYQPAPTYSAPPQGSGARSYPSQGSGSR